MNIKTIKIATKIGLLSVFIGLVFFVLNQYLFDVAGKPVWGYQIALLPGNLSLTYFWHPLLTEEINFVAKLGLLLLGQFILVTAVSAAILYFKTQLIDSKR